MNKGIVLGIFILIICVSLTPNTRGSFKKVKNNDVLKFFNKNSEGLEIFVDQEVETTCGYYSGSLQIKHYMPLGQSFMPLYEFQYGIELYITDSNPQNPLAPIQICLKENNITGPIVPETNVTLNLTSGDGWRFFEFDSPVKLTINQTYVIDISTTNARWSIYHTEGHCYTRGISYYDGIPFPSWDHYFRTHVLNLSYPVADFTYSAGESPVRFNGSLSYDSDGYIVSYAWNFGDCSTGTGKITYHKYCDIATYDVKLTVTDDYGLKGNITKSVDVLFANIPPSIPEIYGPKSGKPRVEYEYDFNVVDPDGDDFYLWVDWGDGNSTGWKGPYHSGEQVIIKHSWNETGIYVIKAKIKDFCYESPWGTLEVTMPRDKSTSNIMFWRSVERFLLLQILLDIWRFNS